MTFLSINPILSYLLPTSMCCRTRYYLPDPPSLMEIKSTSSANLESYLPNCNHDPYSGPTTLKCDIEPIMCVSVLVVRVCLGRYGNILKNADKIAGESASIALAACKWQVEEQTFKHKLDPAKKIIQKSNPTWRISPIIIRAP